MLPIRIDSRELEALYYSAISCASEALSVAVTSSNSKEGVSVTSYALARRAAASGHNTLLIDLNVERSDLSDWLTSKRHTWHPSNLQEMQVIETLGETGLSILSAPDRQSALWSFREKKHLEKMFLDLKEEYDCIIVDVPSVLDNNSEDTVPAETICSVCDKTVLMALSARTSESDMAHTISILKKSNAKVCGIVMNDLYEPALQDEIFREIDRVKRFAPKLAEKLKVIVRRSAFLSQEA